MHSLLAMATPSSSTQVNLRDHLLAALKALPGSREFHLHVLVSSPRRCSELFPYARPRPRVYLQDIFVLLSEQPLPASDAPSSPGTSAEASSDQPARVLVTAIEASLYTLPAASSAILYVSKVDSSGHAAHPSPTSALVRAFLAFHADPRTRPVRAAHLWVQLFARAQAQYLFPNSAAFAGKRPLTDVRLCAWWRRVLGDVGAALHARDGVRVGMWYVLPGYSELEAMHSLRVSGAEPGAEGQARGPRWVYGHPYAQTDVPLPCAGAGDAGAHANLGMFIPCFDDDPKARFMDEIAYTTEHAGVSSPRAKRRRGVRADSDDEREKERDKDRDGVLGELGKVSVAEFWERMSFRQECVAGIVTGFFTLVVSSAIPDPPPAPDVSSISTVSPSHPVTPLSPTRLTAAGAPLSPVKITPSPARKPLSAHKPLSGAVGGASATDASVRAQPGGAGQVAPHLVRRVIAALMNHHEFSTAERAARATATLEEAIRGLCERPAGALLDVPTAAEPDARPPAAPSTPPRRAARLPEVTSPGAESEAGGEEQEPVASLETYRAHIYGSVVVRNPALPRRGGDEGAGNAGSGQGQEAAAPKVTVLAVRKKRKAA
ncbi:hypothetical protein WOLCODRAFT_136611 [Wolfiporia cocos MD-104 SS10]|uniref:histone acetyltransferase n=1 Tax=Wolfiporia cocos (strain MD-104) TaxID=742152 RepID=A0A2H3JEP4_WOLCO|nr:hypothetical protein WOLCODRAFT_136611 [Wolfiporia cocos MD-104 SS10]